MRGTCALTATLAFTAVAAAQPSFRGLGRPAEAEGETVTVATVSDDGQIAAGVIYIYNTYHPGFDPVTVRWSGAAYEILGVSSPRQLTPDGTYLAATSWTIGPGVGDIMARLVGPGSAMGFTPPFPYKIDSQARGVTVDGSAVLAATGEWTGASAIVFSGSGVVQTISAPGFVPQGMSGDAAVISGAIGSAPTAQKPVYLENGQFTDLGPSGTIGTAIVSRDGSTFTGTYQTSAGERAFRADKHGNFHPLGLANFSRNSALCISAAGDVVGGYGWQPVEQRNRAIIWNRAAGTRDLKSVLIQMGVQDVIPWQLSRVTGISGDGAWIVGDGVNPAGKSEPWIARIPPFCYANCDSSTAAPALNVADFNCFLTRFANGDGYANCDRSTAAPVLNVSDFACFLQHFAAGCPE